MAYRPAEQKRYAEERAARARANERRNSQFKHGGGPDKTAERRVLSDEELFGEELSDDDLFGAPDGPPELRSEWDKGGWGDERSAAQALNVLDWMTIGGFGDEVVAAGSGAAELLRTGSWQKASDAYDREVTYARDLKDRWKAQPDTTTGDVVSHAIGIVAGAPVALPMFRGAQAAVRGVTGGKAATAVGRGAQNVAASAATGAAASEALTFGEATGGIGERFNTTMAAGATPLIIGGVLGAAAPVVGAGAGKIATRAAAAMKNSDSRAARYIAEKLLGAGQTADDLAAAHQKAAETGKPVVLADVGPQGVKDAAGAAARTPGPGREIAQKTIGPRQEGQVARVSQDVGDAAGGNPGSYTQTVDDITAQRAAEAKPLYDKAMHQKPLVSPKIVEVTNRPSGKAAMERGLKIARDEGIPDEQLFVKDAQGNVVGYTTKALHYMKMGLDDMIESATRSGDNAAARALTIMKNELLSEMDRLNPAYAKARQAFAGHAANQRALEQGRQAAGTNAHPDQIRSQMAKMSEAEREMFRRGYAQRIIEEVERAPDAGNAVNRIIGNTAKREKLRAVLGDEEYNKLMQRLGVENEMYGTYRRANVGSETAERTAAQADVDEYLFGQTPGLAQGIAQSFASGSVSPLLRAIGMGGIANFLRGLSQKVRGSIAKMLFSSDPKQVRQAITLIRKEYATAKAAQEATDAAIAGLATGDESRTAMGQGAAIASGQSPVQPF